MRTNYTLFALMALMAAPKGFGMLNPQQTDAQADHLEDPEEDVMVEVFKKRLLLGNDGLIDTESFDDQVQRSYEELQNKNLNTELVNNEVERHYNPENFIEESKDNSNQQNVVNTPKNKKKQNKNNKKKEHNKEDLAYLDAIIGQNEQEKLSHLTEVTGLEKEVKRLLTQYGRGSLKPLSYWTQTYQTIHEMIDSLGKKQTINQIKEFNEGLGKDIFESTNIKEELQQVIKKLEELGETPKSLQDSLKRITNDIIEKSNFYKQTTDDNIKVVFTN